jgi:hypothetical protein
MALFVGGTPITPEQLATLKTDLGIPEAEDITERYTSLVGTDDAIFLRSGVPGLVSADVMADTFGGGVSGQSITQSSLFNNSNTFYSGTVALAGGGGQSITQSSRFNNSTTFYGGTVALAITQSSRFNNSQAFYGGTVSLAGGGGAAAYIGETVSTGTNTVTVTLPAGVTASDSVFALLLPAAHGSNSTGIASLAAPSGWTAEDSATVDTMGTRLFSAPGNVAGLTFTATSLRSVLVIGVTGTRRASAMACGYWGELAEAHTTPAVTAGADDLVIAVYAQVDSTAPTFGSPTSGYAEEYLRTDPVPIVRVVSQSEVAAGTTGAISVGGGTNYSTRVFLTLAVQA